MGLIYWRVPAKARSFCVKKLKEIDDHVKSDKTPFRTDAHKARKAKIIEVAASLRKSLALITFPVVVGDEFPMTRYSPTDDDKALYPNWDYSAVDDLKPAV